MKLPDFHNSTLSTLRKKNGIPLNNYINVIEWKKGVMDPKLLELREKGGFIIGTSDDIQVGKDKTLEYLGDKIIVYIYDWVSNFERFGEKPKVHFYECKTIIDMKMKNKFDNKYIGSNNNYNGKYRVLLRVGEENKEVLPICKNCINEARKDGLLDLKILDQPFYLNKYFDFFNYYKNTKFNPKYNFITISKNQYPENWEEISKHERQKVGYICQNCGKDCNNNKGELHVHHIDHNKGNNFSNNFQALCYECHAKLHPHMKNKIF